MIYKKNGRWELMINQGFSETENRRRGRLHGAQDLERGKTRRRIEDREEALKVAREDTW